MVRVSLRGIPNWTWEGFVLRNRTLPTLHCLNLTQILFISTLFNDSPDRRLVMSIAVSPEAEAERTMLSATLSTIWPVLAMLVMFGWTYKDPQLKPNLL